MLMSKNISSIYNMPDGIQAKPATGWNMRWHIRGVPHLGVRVDGIHSLAGHA